MARLVALFFEDNDEADEFLSGLREDVNNEVLDCSVYGLFGVPTKFCECPHNNQTNPRRIARGGKLGWWVHRECGKPLKNSWQSPRNLLDPDMRERDPYIKPTWTFKYNPGLVPE